MFSSLTGGDDLALPPKKKTPKKEKTEKKEEEKKPKEDASVDRYVEKHFQPNRYNCCISTDKNTYKPGEPVYVRAVLLNTFDHKPVGSDEDLGTFHFQIKNAKGEEICKNSVQRNSTDENNSVVCFEWKIPEGAAGGEYSVTIIQVNGNGVPKTSRKFNIRKYEPPRFKKEIKFFQKGYAEGDTCKALLTCTRAEGGFCDPINTKIEAIARLDGNEIFRKNYALTNDGKSLVTFELPPNIVEGIGSLNISIQEGIVETVSKTIPIVLRKLKCIVYPEGGELYYGIENGVYCQAFTPTDDPADFEAILCERDSSRGEKILQHVSTLHEGRAAFSFTPSVGNTYFLRVTKPSGVTHLIDMPAIKEKGVGLFLQKKQTHRFNEDIVVQVNSTEKRNVNVGLFKKEKLVDEYKLEIKPTTNNVVSLKTKNHDGVLRVTVSENNVPLSERLVFVNQKEEMQLDVKMDNKSYTPGDKVVLTIKSNKKNTNVAVTVTDDSVIKMTEKRKRHPRIMASYFLENEVDELNDAEAYFRFDATDLKKVPAEMKMDLILGTQGWRKFIYKDVKAKLQEKDEKVERLMNVNYKKHIPELCKKIKVTKTEYRSVFQQPQLLPSQQIQPIPFPVKNRAPPPRKHAVKKVNLPKKKAAPPKRKKKMKKKMAPPKAIKKPAAPKKKMAPKPRAAAPKKKMAPKPRAAAPKKGKVARGPPARARGRGRASQRGRARSRPMGRPMPAPAMKRPPPPRNMPARAMAMPMRPPQRQMQQQMMPQRRMPFGGRARRDQMFFQPPPPPKLVPVQVIVEEWQDQEDKDIENQVVSPAIVATRVYAHSVRPDRKVGERIDFTETLYFCSSLKIPSDEGVKVSFDLNDSVTSFCVVVDGFSADGVVGFSNDVLVISVKPFFIQPKIPLELSVGDEFLLPVQIVSNIGLKTQVEVEVSRGTATGVKLPNPKFSTALKPKERICEYFKMVVEQNPWNVPLKVSGREVNLQLTDSVDKNIKVTSVGYPCTQSYGGVLGSGVKYEISFPAGAQGFRTEAFLTPSCSADMESSLKSLIRSPGGCFEQTSMTMYPMVMALLYFQTHTCNDTSILDRANGYLDTGYKRLTGYESPKGGFHWWGYDPGHEALTSMGLMQFNELKKVFPAVDQKMIDRTRDWLLSRVSGDKFAFNKSCLHTWTAGQTLVDTYISYALSRAGVEFSKVEKVIARVEREVSVESNPDSYILALLGLALYNYGKKDRSRKLVNDLLAKKQQSDGSLVCGCTITESRGNDKKHEATALGIMNFLNFEKHHEKAKMGIEYLRKNCRYGGYGSTQATVMSLEAIIKADAVLKKPGSGGSGDTKIELVVNDALADTRSVGDKNQTAIHFNDFTRSLKPKGKNTIELKVGDGGVKKPIPFSLNVYWTAPMPNIPESQSLIFKVKLRNTQLKEGETTEVEVEITNKQENKLPMTVAIVALPSGASARYEKLQELKKKRVCEFFELFGARKVVFYFDHFEKKETKKFSFDVTADIPGKYVAEASEAYLYYGKSTSLVYHEGLQMGIEPKK